VRIFGWAADNAGPGWYRLRVPLTEMARHTDHDVTVDTRMPDWVVEEADVVVGQRVCQPGAAARWLRMAGGAYGRRPLLVFEIDDDLWNVEPANLPAWNFYRSSPELLENLKLCAAAADVCTVSTEELADVVRKFNPHVVVLPNQLPASAFAPNWADTVRGSWRIGWGGGASHVDDVEEMVPALRQHFRRCPEDAFLNLGMLFESVRKAAFGRLMSFPWTDDMAEHYRRVGTLDIGLAPLRASVFNRSKSEIKFLEYAAAGAACIASRVGPYERVLAGGWPEDLGVLVSRPHEWAVALRRLTEDPAERIVLAANALAYARTRHIERHWQSWEKVYAQG
jgi:hypothetical protein